MTKDEFEKEKQKFKADFKAKRDELLKAEVEETKLALKKHLDFKLKNCQVNVGDFVEFSGRFWRVIGVKVESLQWSGSDVCARLERVKKDKTPTVRAEFELAAVDGLKKI